MRGFMQDVWSELGAPSSTAAKSADSMLMHMRSGTPPGADYFYTYHNRSVCYFCMSVIMGSSMTGQSAAISAGTCSALTLYRVPHTKSDKQWPSAPPSAMQGAGHSV